MIPFWNTGARPSLVVIILMRLAIASLLALVLQICIVTLTSRDEDDLARAYVYWEARALAEGLSPTASGFTFQLPKSVAYYADARSSGYAFRILDRTGSVIATGNAPLLQSISPWSSVANPRPDTWVSSLGPKWLHVAGGERLLVDGKDVFIEVATLGDPADARWRSIASEISEDVLSPMLPLTLLLLAVAAGSIRWSLQPLIDAAHKAEQITEIDRRERFDLDGMPQEAASFARAINRLLDRIGALVESQRNFIARAAHELRTPLAIILLELGKIGDDRARRLEADVTAMSEAVSRLLTLARLKGPQKPQRAKVDLIALAEDVVGRMRPWASEHDHKLNLATPDASCDVMADSSLLREALRNLVENAVKHTPPGTRIDVILTPDLDLIVEDDGPGIPEAEREEWFEPFRKGAAASEGAGLGLSIVMEAMELHGGRVEVTTSQTGGTRFRMRLQTQPRVYKRIPKPTAPNLRS